MPFVLDASIVGCWCFQDQHDARADAAWELLELGSEHAFVPPHWWFEVRNIVLQGERQGRVTEDYTPRFLRSLERMAIDHRAVPDQIALLALARRHRLSFYDAAYLELAQRERLALATLDNELTNAAQAEDVSLIRAAT